MKFHVFCESHFKGISKSRGRVPPSETNRKHGQCAEWYSVGLCCWQICTACVMQPQKPWTECWRNAVNVLWNPWCKRFGLFSQGKEKPEFSLDTFALSLFKNSRHFSYWVCIVLLSNPPFTKQTKVCLTKTYLDIQSQGEGLGIRAICHFVKI